VRIRPICAATGYPIHVGGTEGGPGEGPLLPDTAALVLGRPCVPRSGLQASSRHPSSAPSAERLWARLPVSIDGNGHRPVEGKAPFGCSGRRFRRPSKRRFVAIALALSLLVPPVWLGSQSFLSSRHHRAGSTSARPAAAGPGPTTTVTSSALPRSHRRPLRRRPPKPDPSPDMLRRGTSLHRSLPRRPSRHGPWSPRQPQSPRRQHRLPATSKPAEDAFPELLAKLTRGGPAWSSFKADGKPAWPGASEGWSGPIGIAEFPGHGEMQALSTLVFPNGKAFQQCYWRGDQSFCRQVDFNVDGSPRWPGASQGWSPPLDLAGRACPASGQSVRRIRSSIPTPDVPGMLTVEAARGSAARSTSGPTAPPTGRPFLRLVGPPRDGAATRDGRRPGATSLSAPRRQSLHAEPVAG